MFNQFNNFSNHFSKFCPQMIWLYYKALRKQVKSKFPLNKWWFAQCVKKMQEKRSGKRNSSGRIPFRLEVELASTSRTTKQLSNPQPHVHTNENEKESRMMQKSREESENNKNTLKQKKKKRKAKKRSLWQTRYFMKCKQ